MSYSSEVLADSPWGFWLNDETSGTTLADSSGNSRPMTTVATPTLAQSGPFTGASSVLYTSAQNYALTSATLSSSTATFETWVYFPSSSSSPLLRMMLLAFNVTYDGSATGLTLGIETGDFLSLSSDGSGPTLKVTAPTAMSRDTWHHVVGSVGAAGLKLRVDKSTVASAGGITSQTTTARPVMARGRRNDTGAGGDYRESSPVRLGPTSVYATQLSDARTDAHYDATGGPAPVVIGGSLAAETDAVQAGSATVGAVASGGQAVETDTPRGGTSSVAVPGGRASEADTAQGGTASVGQAVVGGQAAETDSGQAGSVAAGAVVAGSQGAETDSAQAGTVATGEIVTGGQAGEADSAQAGSTIAGAVVAGGQASETDAAQAGSVAAAQTIAGTQATETDAAQGGSVDVGDAMTTLDLSTAAPLLGSPDWDGTSLPGGYYTFPYHAVDFATTYTVEADYIHDGSGTPGFLGLFGILSPDDAGAVDTNYLFATDGTLTGTATATLTIGPGVGEWADAEAAAARFLMIYTDALAITAIRVSPEFEPGLEPPAPSGTDTTNGAHLRTRGGWAVASWEPAVTPLPLPALGHAVVTAAAFGAVTMQGSQPVFTVSRAEKPRLRQRIVVGGVDMTLHRGVMAPDAVFQLADPLLYGPATIELPSISAVFEQGAHPHLAKGKRVKVQLVDDDDVIVKTVHKGFVMAHGVSGRNLVLEVGGEAQGRASLRDKQPPIFRDVLDLSRHAWRAITDLGLRYLPRLGEPGIGIRSLTFGGTGMLEHIEEIIARATKKDGTQRTIMPDTDGVYRLSDKDATTIHYTLFVDDAHVVPDLRSDMSEEPTRIYATTITPAGMRVRFGAYPGLIQGPTPDYPMDDDSSLTEGATDEDTDSGDGISVMINRLGATGFLDIRDTPGGFDEDVTDALAALQRAAGLTGPVGVMTPDLWAALWDLDVTGYDRRWSSIQPAAEDDSVRRYDRSASGAVIGLNADRDPDEIPVDRTVDMGSGFTRKQARDFSRSLVHDPDADDWFGTITVNTGAVLAGTVAIGATVTAADLVDARLVKPGENIYLPNFAGGIVVHVSGVDVSATNVRFTVDTRARPAREVWERIQVRRESRRNPARGWQGTRQSTSIKDAVQGFDEIGGVIDRNIPLEAGWNKIEVVAGDYGTIGAFRSIVQTVSGTGGEIAIEAHEYAVMVFGKEPSVARLNSDVGNPLTEAGERAIRRSAKGYLDSRWLLYSAGTEAEPCGYGADRKSDGATLTGEHVDAASFSYAADNGCTLFVAIWVAEETTLRKGRIMWPQLEGGV